LGPIPNPQSPIPNPQSPYKDEIVIYTIKILLLKKYIYFPKNGNK